MAKNLLGSSWWVIILWWIIIKKIKKSLNISQAVSIVAASPHLSPSEKQKPFCILFVLASHTVLLYLRPDELGPNPWNGWKTTCRHLAKSVGKQKVNYKYGVLVDCPVTAALYFPKLLCSHQTHGLAKVGGLGLGGWRGVHFFFSFVFLEETASI